MAQARDLLAGTPYDLVELLEKAQIKVTLDLLVNLEKRIEVGVGEAASSVYDLLVEPSVA